MANMTHYTLTALVVALLVMTLMAGDISAAPSRGRCDLTSYQWQRIVFSMCRGGRLKRSADSSMSRVIRGVYKCLPRV